MELNIGIVFAGFVATSLVQWLKTKWQLNEAGTLSLVAFIAFVGACIYTALQWFGFWESFAGILMVAGSIYTYLFQRFEAKAPTQLPGVPLDLTQ